MSLTSELDDSKSKVRLFMTEHFPNTALVSQSCNPQLRALNRATVPGYDYGMIGTAFDYRARYYFEITPCKEFVADRGAKKLIQDARFTPKLIAAFFSNLTKFVEKVQPHRKVLSDRDEQQLARYCVVLTLLEQRYRVGPRLHALNSVLWAIDRAETDARTLLQVAKLEWIEDLVNLSHGFRDSQSGLYKHLATLNPIFDGSADIAGADADLIVDHCLVEIKTIVRAEITRDVLYQLLGYTLLDYTDSYQFHAVALYWARQRHFIKWMLPDLLRDLTGWAQPDLSALRSAFKAEIQPLAEEFRRKRAAKHMVAK